jgi:hypothetical protein
MSNGKVDRNSEYMRQMWGTTRLVTDYSPSQELNQRVIQEIMHDYAPKHNLKVQTDLHEKIRNDEDYDDWEYGTEPSYGSSWK